MERPPSELTSRICTGHKRALIGIHDKQTEKWGTTHNKRTFTLLQEPERFRHSPKVKQVFPCQLWIAWIFSLSLYSLGSSCISKSHSWDNAGGRQKNSTKKKIVNPPWWRKMHIGVDIPWLILPPSWKAAKPLGTGIPFQSPPLHCTLSYLWTIESIFLQLWKALIFCTLLECKSVRVYISRYKGGKTNMFWN